MTTRRVRNFRLVEEIGTGGMGTIWRAIQEPLERPVALKELHAHLAKDPDFLARFEREAKAAAAIHHENVVTVIDFGREGDACFLALEYVEGPDLKTMLERAAPASAPDAARRVSLPIALSIVIDVLRGLAAAHSRGVVHRDVKPANVLLAKDGVAKIADFSIALVQASAAITTTGMSMGTPAYMSPEQAGGGRAIDARSDVFSAGVVLWEMIAGQKPFEGDTYAQIVGRVLTHEPRDLSEIDRLVPARVSRAVRRALEKDPDRRWPTGDEMRRELEEAAREAEIAISRPLVSQWIADPAGFQITHRRQRAMEAFHRGVFLMSQGKARLAEARDLLSAAVELDPEHEEARKKLQEVTAKRPVVTHDEVTPPPMPAVRGPRPNVPLAIAAAVLLALLAWGARTFLGSPDATPTPVAVALPTEAAISATQAAISPTALATATIATPVATRTKVAIVATPAPTPTPATPTPAAVASPTRAREIAIVDPLEQSVGWLKLLVTPWAKVYVDGEKVADTPWQAPLKLHKGRHTIRLEHPDFPAHEETLEITPGAILTHRVTLTR